MMNFSLVAGLSGLIGSQMAAFFHQNKYAIHRVDNDRREVCLEAQGGTPGDQNRLQSHLSGFHPHEPPIPNRRGVLRSTDAFKSGVTVHAVAQTSHDLVTQTRSESLPSWVDLAED